MMSPEEVSFRSALRALAQAHSGMVDEAKVAELVPERALRTLLRHHERVRWSDWAVRLLLRAALVHGATRDDYLLLADHYSGRSTTFRPSMIDGLKEGNSEKVEDWLNMRSRDRAWFSRDELRMMEFSVLPNLHGHELLPRVVDMGFRSAIHRAGDGDADLVRKWTRIAQDHQDAVGL
jgi:hypothetical protein